MRYLLFFSMFTFGCAGDTATDVKDTDAAADTDVSGETDVSGDTELTDDTDAAGDTDVVVASYPCLAMHGIHSANSSWAYRWTNSSRTGYRTMGTYEYDYAANTATLLTTESWTDQAASFSGTTYEYLECTPEGLFITKKIVDTTLTIFGPAEVSHSETVYSTPALVRPNMIVMDDTWTSHMVGTTTRTNGTPPQNFDTTTTYAVVEVDILTGEGFNSTKIETNGGPSYYYWALGQGVVYLPSIAWLTTHTP
jgi:hypothetical protein